MGSLVHLIVFSVICQLHNFTLAVRKIEDDESDVDEDAPLSDRTRWRHVCVEDDDWIEETCLWRVEAVRQLKEITKQAEMPIPITSPNHNPSHFSENNCLEYLDFKVDRAKERFKERVEAAIGEDIVARVIKIGDGIRELNEYDAKTRITLELLEKWKDCMGGIHASDSTCKTEARTLNDHFDAALGDSTERITNTSTRLRNAKYRVAHLKDRNPILETIFGLVKPLADATSRAYNTRADGDFKIDGLDEKCKIKFPKKWEKFENLHTSYIDDINHKSDDLLKSVENIRSIDKDRELHLNTLLEFRSCEEEKGKFDIDCAQIRQKADEIEPIFALTDNEKHKMQKEERIADRLRRIQSSHGSRKPLFPLVISYNNNTDTRISDFIHSLNSTMSMVAAEVWNFPMTVMDVANSEASCKAIFDQTTDPQKLEDSHIKDMKKSLANIHHVTREALEFRSKVHLYSKAREEFIDCVEKKKRNCDSVEYSKKEKLRIDDLREIMNKKSNKKRMTRTSKRIGHYMRSTGLSPSQHQAFLKDCDAYFNNMWNGVKSAVQQWRDTPLMENGWLYPGPVRFFPIPAIYKLVRDVRCKKVLQDSATKLEQFHKSLNETYAAFGAANDRLDNGNVIADQVTRLVVCNDQDEEDCKYLREGLEEKMTEQPSA